MRTLILSLTIACMASLADLAAQTQRLHIVDIGIVKALQKIQ